MPLVTTPTGDTFDETNPVALAYYLREDGYKVDGDEPVVEQLEQSLGTFDPNEHTVEEVNAYLETASEAEQGRVLDAEAAGKARKGILGDEE